MAWTEPGETMTAGLMNQQVRDNLNELGGAWTAYTPTLTGWTIGNGNVVGRYMQAGKDTKAYVKITVGSSTTFGNLTVSLPVTLEALITYEAAA